MVIMGHDFLFTNREIVVLTHDYSSETIYWPTEDGFRLGSWLGTRRKDYKQGKLAEDRIKALEQLPGWTWDPLETDWIEGLGHLAKYVDEKGHARAPRGYVTEDGFRLGTWVRTRRSIYRKGQLTEDRIRALEQIPGWTWDSRKKKKG